MDHPRVRGDKVGALVDSAIEMRITPACAGIRKLKCVTASPSRDHPRVRGDKLPPLGGRPAVQGSPPRARG